MSKVLTKQVQNKVSRYFLKLENHLTKPESRCVREMATGILKSGTVLVNKIATGIAGKNKKHKISFTCGAVKVKYKAKDKEHELWLVVTKCENGGYCWLLTCSLKKILLTL